MKISATPSVLAILVLSILPFLSSTAHGEDALPKDALDHVTHSLYEVVVVKPDDNVKYDRPLNLGSQPFKKRTDKFMSRGSAFAIGPNEYVSAAHVLEIDTMTQHKGLAIRDQEGRVFPIRNIKKYSLRRDFAVFDVASGTEARFLLPNISPSMNSKVYAVGNALGEGVVVRDGLLTSMTPEDSQGEWKWLRFSAAASPGNSGGALVDKEGKVMGLVVRKSPNENLNYALPIGEIISAPVEAHLFFEGKFSVENLNLRKRAVLDKKLPLPAPVEAVRAAIWDEKKKFKKKMYDEIIITNRDNIFPHGMESQKVIGIPFTSEFPNLLTRGNSGVWSFNMPKDVRSHDLGRNGVIHHGKLNDYIFCYVRKPDNIPLKKLLSDSRMMMDLILKGVTITKTFSDEEYRIVSFGEAESTFLHTDTWGRKWLVNTWPINFSDEKIIMFSAPVPGGFLSIMEITDPGEAETCSLHKLRITADYITMQLSGKVTEWQEYMSINDFLPPTFAKVTTGVDKDHRFHFTSSRFGFVCNQEIMKGSDTTNLAMSPGFVKNGERIEWEVVQVIVGDEMSAKGFVVTRTEKPARESDEEDVTTWQKMIEKKPPFDGSIISMSGVNAVGGVVPSDVPPEELQKADVLFSVFLLQQGDQTKEAMNKSLASFINSIAISEACGLQTSKKVD